MCSISNISIIHFGFRFFKDVNTSNAITCMRPKCRVEILPFSNKPSYVVVWLSYTHFNALHCIVYTSFIGKNITTKTLKNGAIVHICANTNVLYMISHFIYAITSIQDICLGTFFHES